MRISDWSSDVCSSDLIPTVLTLKGLGALPAAHPLHLGMLGMHGSRAANMAVQESDLLVVVGARFDDRATGKLAEFAPLAEVIHLDLDRSEEHTSELQSILRISYDVFCLKKKKKHDKKLHNHENYVQ